jgi:membrane protein
MSSLKERLSARVARIRERYPAVDHLVETIAYYGRVNGNGQAGAVTYFGFLSFFPLLALAFFLVGYISKVYDLQPEMRNLVEQILPNIIGKAEEGKIPLSEFENGAAAAGLIGLVGLLYTGLGWLSAMRNSFLVMFQLPLQEKPNFVLGKARDLLTLALLGVVLLVSVALTSSLTWLSEEILGWVGLEGSLLARGFLWAVGTALALAATSVLILTMFRQLGRPHLPGRALLQGAILGAIGFEVLKAAAGLLLAGTRGAPSFQAFGVALILLVWINYFSRLVMFSAAWAYTSPLSVRLRELEETPFADPDDQELLDPAPAAVAAEDDEGSPTPRERRNRGRTAAAGAGLVAGVALVVGRRLRR